MCSEVQCLVKCIREIVHLEMLSSKLAHLNHCFGNVQETGMYTQQLDLMYWVVLVEYLTLRLCMA